MTSEQSAGGVVIAWDLAGVPHIALVGSQDGKWRLPKGHIESTESQVEAALREVAEEVGLTTSTIHLGHYLGCFAFNEFEPGGQAKFNHFFLMRLAVDDLPELETDAAHQRAAWWPLPLQQVPMAYDYQANLIEQLGPYLIKSPRTELERDNK